VCTSGWKFGLAQGISPGGLSILAAGTLVRHDADVSATRATIRISASRRDPMTRANAATPDRREDAMVRI